MNTLIDILKYILFGGAIRKRPSAPLPENQLINKYLLYRSRSRKEFHGCDGLLFTAIGQAAGACEDIKLTAFEDRKEPGRWYRSPDQLCYDTGRSKSDISKDMMMGLALWCSVYRAAPVAQRTLKYALRRAGNMGRPISLISRTLMSPNLMYYFWLLSKPGRKVGPLGRLLLATSHLSPRTGFQAHLQALSILLLARLEGGLGPISLRTLKKLSDASPRNALFLAILGEHKRCAQVLLNKDLFPENQLPSTQNYSTEYLWQRSPNENIKDWLPSSQEPAKMHTGIDFLIATAIYLGMV